MMVAVGVEYLWTRPGWCLFIDRALIVYIEQCRVSMLSGCVVEISCAKAESLTE